MLKGSTSSHTSLINQATSGTFSNANLKTPSGNPAGISNIQFCAGTPSSGGDTGGGDTGGGDNGPDPFCPVGTVLAAKFEWSGQRYVFEKPAGNGSLVNISGTSETGTWSAPGIKIGAILLKGARDTDLVYLPGATSGTFSNANLTTKSGNLAGISNIQFCICDEKALQPPAINITETNGTIKVDVSDQTGIGSINFTTLTNVTADPGNSFTPGAKTASFSFAVVNTGADATVAVEATDLCGLVSTGSLTKPGNVCVGDQGPPVIAYNFVGTDKIEVSITDDTGIQTIDASVTPAFSGQTPGVVEDASQRVFTPGAKTAKLVFQVTNFSLRASSFIKISATDLCGVSTCPGNTFPPRVQGRTTSTGARITISDSSPLKSVQFFNMINSYAANQNPADPAGTFLFTADIIRNGPGWTYGVLATDECNATVIDPAEGDTYDLEVGGEEPSMAVAANPAGALESVSLALTVEELPREFSLDGNYPNPFNPSTQINFSMPEAAAVSLVVYDVMGHEVAVLVDAELQAGRHKVNFDASHLPSGTYLYRLVTPQQTFVKRMVLVK